MDLDVFKISNTGFTAFLVGLCLVSELPPTASLRLSFRISHISNVSSE
jgi:hypothetical protein